MTHPPHRLQPLGRNDRLRDLRPMHRLNVLFCVDGERRAAKVPGSHFAYDAARHAERLYLFEDATSFRAWSNHADYTASHLYPIAMLPQLFTQSGRFFGDIQHIDARGGLSNASFTRILAEDLIDTGHVTFLDTETGHVTVVPTPVTEQPVTFDAASRWTLYQPTDDGTLRRAVLEGSHFLWYGYQLVLLTSHDDLNRAIDGLRLPRDEHHNYLYPVAHLADVFCDVAPGTLLSRLAPDPACEEFLDAITLSGDRVVSFVPEGR